MLEQTNQRRAAERIVRELRERGHAAYFAGGCVRDMLIGTEPKDYDVATDAMPEVVKRIFRNAKYVGEAFGVVLVRLMRCEVEVATFRTEGAYSDGRRPDEVRFTDAEHDAQRRDFTINGLFYDPLEDRVIDYVGGQADIKRKIIRAIGDANQRFAEDYLRMLRAVRFAARLGWKMDEATAEAIAAHARKLERISRERIGMEVLMMMAGSQPRAETRAEAARWLTELGLDAVVLDEKHCERACPTLAALDSEADAVTALAAWVLDRHMDESGAWAERLARLKVVRIARRWRAALVLSNEQVTQLQDRLKGLTQLAGWERLTVAQRKRLLADTQWRAIEQLAGAVELMDMRQLTKQAMALRQDGIGIAPKPLITGDDLVAAGMQPGPVFKRILDTVYDAQLEGRVTGKHEAMTMALRMAG